MKICFRTLSYRLHLSLVIVALLTSCVSDSAPEQEPESEQEVPQPPAATEPVPPDGIMETVTWNIEWYGSNSNGPSDELQQTKNILEVSDSLKADLYAMQEIYSQQRLDSLTQYMTGYRGFVADYVSYNQKMAFVYNTNTIDSVSAGAISQGQDEYDWASGRLPFYFSFNYNYSNETVKIYAIVIHAKANTGDNQQEREEAYNRRKRAASSLYTYLMDQEPDSHIILLGDFNDDVDETIYDGSSASPYVDFVNDADNFRTVTESISEQGGSSYIAGNYSDLIDHIVISNELFDTFVDTSEEIFKADDFIENYVNNTSDHLPVWAKFDFSGQNQK